MRVLRPRGALAGKRVLVTAGPTLEDIDPVRFIGNRSSGRMGYAIAAEAARRGARVTLVSGPTSRASRRESTKRVDGPQRRRHAPGGAVACAADMDVVVMAAAVADYTIGGARLPEDRQAAMRRWCSRSPRTTGHSRRSWANCRRAETRPAPPARRLCRRNA